MKRQEVLEASLYEKEWKISDDIDYKQVKAEMIKISYKKLA